jgi:hypothetical protein
MLRLLGTLLLGGASGACGLAALGMALYVGSPTQTAAVLLFAGTGFGAGLLCGGLHVVFAGLPAWAAPVLSPEDGAAGASATPARLAAAALAGAAARSMPPDRPDTPIAAGEAPASGAPARLPAPTAVPRRFASSRFGA